jgi:hypothetical protein
MVRGQNPVGSEGEIQSSEKMKSIGERGRNPVVKEGEIQW